MRTGWGDCRIILCKYLTGPRKLYHIYHLALIPSCKQIIPLCATLPDLSEILGAPVGQALPYIFGRVVGSGGGLALTILVLIITLFCSISITVAASRCTWAFARDNAIPFAHLWAKIDERHGTPIWALVLTTFIEMLLGLINLGSSSAFLAFVSVGVISLAVSYAIPITISLFHMRKEVNSARWTMGRYLGLVVNLLALAWIAFEVVLFSMPTALPVTEVSMNYAVVVFTGFMVLSAIWYAVYARKGEYHDYFNLNGLFCSYLGMRLMRYGGFSVSRPTRIRWPHIRHLSHARLRVYLYFSKATILRLK